MTLNSQKGLLLCALPSVPPALFPPPSRQPVGQVVYDLLILFPVMKLG
jgi:hypothetical protein